MTITEKLGILPEDRYEIIKKLLAEEAEACADEHCVQQDQALSVILDTLYTEIVSS